MNFINRNFTLPEPNENFGKVKITSSDISLKYVMTNNRIDFIMTYVVVIFKQNPKNPALPLQYTQVDLPSLKEAILNKFKLDDKKYITISSFDTSKVIIKFDHEKWIRDAFNGVNGQPRLSKFELEFKLKKMIPSFIVYDGFMVMFNEFIAVKMSDYVKKNKLGKTYFMKIASSLFKNKVDRYFDNMVEYIYNYQQNAFFIRLKSLYVLLFVYGIIC